MPQSPQVPLSDLTARRLDLAGTRGFTTDGAGQQRRAAIAQFGRSWLQQRWQEATKGRRYDGVALAAVGSLARGDGGPLSDYDLVIVHYGRSLPEAELTALADRLWYPIWDAGVQLDHSVRTVNQCRAVAAADLSAAVGMLDMDLVDGDPEVVTGVRATVGHDWRANARRRLPQLVESLDARHRRHGDLAHTIEPDLKEARGGLRDMTVLRALAAAWLADRPHGAVDEAYQHLLDVRDALHVVTGRGRDRLGLEDHDAVAALLGHADADGMLTGVSASARTIAYALDGTMRRASQSQRARSLRVGPRRPQLNPLGYGLFEHDGEVVLGGRADPAADPLLILRAAVISARSGVPLGPTTLANLAEHSPPLPQPWPPMARALFADLLASGPGLVNVWEGLDLAGVVERWIPEWADVRCRPQRNPVHRHTVDRHLVEAVVEATALVRDVERPDLLLLAALLHDIGKVAGAHDHSRVGAPIAATVALRLGLGQEEASLVELLVREHLTLIDLATRRDPQDPQTLEAVADAVGGRRSTLDLLCALTEADARAAGPAAWTEWRARLLAQLVGAVRARLAAGIGAGVEPDLECSAAGGADGGDGTDGTGEERSVAEDGDGLDPAIRASVAAGDPRVVVTALGGVHRLDVYDRDRLGLFADTAGLLAASGHVVRIAVVRTVDGIAANQWQVETPGGHTPKAEDLERGLRRLAQNDRSPLHALERRRSPQATPSGRATSGAPGQARAMVVPHASDDASVIEVRAQDRPGLLHDIGVAFARAGLSVRSAHIATYAGQTSDTFYITELGGRPLSPARVAQAVSLVIDACDGMTIRGR